MVDKKYESGLVEFQEKVSRDQICRLAEHVENIERSSRRCDLIIENVPIDKTGISGECLTDVVDPITIHYSLQFAASGILFWKRLRHGGTVKNNKPESILVPQTTRRSLHSF